MANKVKIQIGGIEYTINTEESPEYVAALGEELNARLKKISESDQYLSATMAASIAALQYCDEAKSRRRELEKLKAEIAAAGQTAAAAELKLAEARRELERITRENRTLRSKVVKQKQ